MTAALPRVVALLERDVVRTVGEPYRALVHEVAALVQTLELTDPGEKVVEDVQQQLHDTFVDTTWPTCPRHARHPLWYKEGAWWCDRDGAMVAPLGALGERPRPAG
jgi:hypothetical protein